MIQSEATIERARVDTYGSPESAIFGWPAGSAESTDDDALFDSWLASMDSREFELILSRLASLPSALEASA
jgi:hypothetical protein